MKFQFGFSFDYFVTLFTLDIFSFALSFDLIIFDLKMNPFDVEPHGSFSCENFSTMFAGTGRDVGSTSARLIYLSISFAFILNLHFFFKI